MTKVYIPIEISSRELDAKLLLASKLINLGFKVVIGKKKQLLEFMSVAEPGIFVSIWGGHANFEKLYKSLLNKGHVIVTLDEEGLITLSDEFYLTKSINLSTLEAVSTFFCWGEKQKRMLEGYASTSGNASTKFVSSGNIRFDLLAPEFDSLYLEDQNKIKARYSGCILLISSFGSAKHFLGAQKYLELLINDGVLVGEKQISDYRRYLEFQKKNARRFFELLERLCRDFPDRPVVYRPHPAEDFEEVGLIAKTHKNLFIDNSYSIIPWLRSSSFSVYHYCTTSLEAQILGCPSAAYRPFQDTTIEKEFVYACAHQFASPDLLVSYIKRVINGNTKPQNVAELDQLSEIISGLSGMKSADQMAANILKLKSKIQHGVKRPIKEYWLFKLKNQLKKDTGYVMHKYGSVDAKLISSKLKKLRQKKQKDLSVSMFAKHLFEIS